ncbi:porin family protein [Bradyrhizobium xenonodulans]|uniref:Porin family protein n=1 Tax=Bradyrhizobium xenonodulans TaxID=2736875 RepID=A0ABY7MAW7_9BRAD|nr:outer membrane protein [Bradyrhizobium xenonodulans]WBL75365.1 porin family protein [Bradyrhizobium xenonodulans]
MQAFRLGFAAAMVLGGISTASAADLAARPYTKAPPMVAAVYDWTGFYIGLNAGYGWGRNGHQDILPPAGGFWTPFALGFGSTQTVNPEGGVYGGQLGYNWQSANWVFGLEGQFDGASIRRTDISIFFPASDRLSSRINSFATVTGRVGYAFNNWLPYIKGGYAGADLKTSNFDIFGTHLDHGAWRNGYVVGAGVEYAFAGNWIVGAEYNYMEFNKQSFAGPNLTTGAPFGAENFSDSLRLQTVTARISYKFGPSAR